LSGKSKQMIDQILVEKTCEAVRSLYGQDLQPSSVGFEKTKKEIPGDFTIVIFPFTRFSGKSPENTATEIGTYLQHHVPEISQFQVIKGFLNVFLSNEYWINFIKKSHDKKEFGFLKKKEEHPYIVEYSSPNTNKPLHLGHIRNNLLGYSLSEILKANGHKVIRINLINDRGIHICKSMLAYMKWGMNETPESTCIKGDHLIGKYYVMFELHYKNEIRSLIDKGLTEQEAERQAPLIAEAQELLRKWETKEREIMELWHQMNGWAYKGFEETYTRLGICFDKTQYESETYLFGKELIEEGLDENILYKKSDGSVWADLTEDGLDEKLLLRSDGTSVYMTQDLGTAELRNKTWQPSRMIYVVGNEQNYHFDVLKIILKRLKRDWSDRICHLSYGMVELPHGKMKSREGSVVDADDLMDEMYKTAELTTRELGKVNDFSREEAESLFRIISLGALKYFILKVDPKKNMLFDPKESIDFNGNTGPFIQYTYARIQSLLRKAQDPAIQPAVSNGIKYESTGLLKVEREIIKLLYHFPGIIKQAGDEMNPALVANYIYDLAKEYNQFYQEIPVLKEENRSIVSFRLTLSEFTGDVIRKAMKLLGIEVPGRM
jgi:arginyl-tRNA synthetase